MFLVLFPRPELADLRPLYLAMPSQNEIDAVERLAHPPRLVICPISALVPKLQRPRILLFCIFF